MLINHKITTTRKITMRKRRKFSMMIICLDMKLQKERKNKQIKRIKNKIKKNKPKTTISINQSVSLTNHQRRKNLKLRCYISQRILKS